MKSTILGITLAAVLLPTIALAHDRDNDESTINFNGPAQLTNIAELTKDSGFFTEKDFIMEGHILRQISHDEFVFSDGQNELNIELDNEAPLPSFNETTKIRIFGEYEGGLKPEAEVERLLLL